MTWAMRHSGTVVVWVGIVSVLAAMQLPQLEVSISPQSLIIEDDPEQLFYEDTLQTFGSDRITIVHLADDALFDRPRLEAIAGVIADIEALPFVDRTLSLFNLPDVRVDGEQVSAGPYLDEYPDNPAQAARLIERALGNPFVRKNLLSTDGRAMAVNVYLKPDTDAQDPAFDAYVADALDQALSSLTGVVDDAYQIGLPYVRSTIAEEVVDEQYRILLAALGVLLAALFIMFRRGTVLLVPALTSGLSVLWLLGGMAALGRPLNILTALVPVLLVIVGSTEDVHLLADAYDGLERGLSSRRVIRATIRRLGLAISLTFATSCLGFVAVGANPIGLVRDFGTVAAAGLTINFTLTALLVPLLLRLARERKTGAGSGRMAVLYDGFSALATRWVLARRRLVLCVSALLMLGLGYAATSLQVNNNILNYLGPDSPVQQRIRAVQARLAGLYTLQIVVDGHIDGAFDRVAYLEELQKIQGFIDRHPALDNSMSIVDYLSVLNSAVNDTGEPGLPDDDDLVETLMLFLDPDDVREYLSRDRSKASIVVRHGISESQSLGKVLGELEDYLVRHVEPDLKVTVTGESVLTDNAVAYLVSGQLRSLALIVAAIFGVTALLFVTPKAGMIALLVNLFPIVVLFGVMAIAGIPLDSATSMIAALAVGIGVDHTVHFMVRYNRHAGGRVDELTALSRTIRDEARPIGAATVALAAGFATLAWSGFPPIRYFGLLTAMTMLSAFAATFLMTPALLSYVRLTTIWEMLGARVRHELCERCALFRGMSAWQIRRIIVLGRVRRYAPGETIIGRGESGRAIQVLLGGRVVIDAGQTGVGARPAQVASAGEVFGVVAFVHGDPRTMTAMAAGSAEVLILDWDRLQRAARFFPGTALRLFGNLAAINGAAAAAPRAATARPTRSRRRLQAVPLLGRRIGSGC